MVIPAGRITAIAPVPKAKEIVALSPRSNELIRIQILELQLVENSKH